MNRTDLVSEACAPHYQALSEGIEKTEEIINSIPVERIKIISDEAFYKTGKPKGNYLTLNTVPFGEDAEDGELLSKAICSCLKEMLPSSGDAMIVGLGNRAITPDALGPLTANKIIATRHFTKEVAEQIGLDSMRAVTSLAPGVLGQTGMEVQEIVVSVVEKTKPSCVIVIDALAAQSAKRLGTTVQICDTGIAPGSGVQNSRKELSPATLGVPVIAIGVPTVIDAASLACELTGTEELDNDKRKEIEPFGAPMMVTPRDIDQLMKRAAHIIALAINMALQPKLKIGEILYLAPQ